jgi:hypothetical protein
MPRISATSFAVLPTPLLFELAEHKNIGWVYMMLHHHGNGSPEGAWASVATLAQECHMSVKAVKTALRWLLENGWVERVSRPGFSSRYHLKMDTPTKPNGTQGPNGTWGPNDPQGVGSKRTPGGGGQMDPTNQIPRTRSQEPNPIKRGSGSVEGQSSGRSAATLPATDQVPKPDRPRTPTKNSRDPFESKVLPAGAVPEDLSACSQLLADWWDVKGKGRTQRAFAIACSFLRKLDPPDRIRCLEKAVMGGHQGLYPPSPQPQRRPDPNPGPPMPSYGKGRCTSPHAIDPNTWVPGPDDL